jgi:HEAT repeat protein
MPPLPSEPVEPGPPLLERPGGFDIAAVKPPEVPGPRTELPVVADLTAKDPGPVAAEPPEGVRALLVLLESAKKKERLRGAAGLGRYGSAARMAAPKLAVTMVADPDNAVANEAAVSLARIGRAGVPHLIEALRHDSAPVRQRAAAVLALVGPEARAAVPELLRTLKDDRPKVRAVATYALGEVGGDPGEVVPALCLAFGDVDVEVRKNASVALVTLGEPAVPALRKQLQSPSRAVRRDAARVLGMMGVEAKAAATDLALLLPDPDPQVRADAAGALAAMRTEAQAAIPALLKAMRVENRFEVQQQLFQALTLVGSRDLPGFLKAVREIDRQGQWATPYRLGQFGPHGEDAVKPLIKLLRDPQPGKRLAAALALGKLGLLSDQSVPALLKAMDDPSPQVCVAASISLCKLAPGHERVAEFKLTAALKALSDLVARLAAQQLPGGTQNPGFSGSRPYSRRAVLDPTVQARYDQLLDLYLLVSTPDCPSTKLWRKVAKSFPQSALESQVSRLVWMLPPDAAPAFARAISKAAQFNLGFC